MRKWATFSWQKKSGKKVTYALKESNYHVLAKKRPFWVKFGGVFRPPGPPILDQDGPCGLQILPNTPPWVKRKQIDLLVQSKSQSCFSQKKPLVLAGKWLFWCQFWGCFRPPGPSEFIFNGSNGRQILASSPLRVKRGRNNHLDDFGGWNISF